MSCWNTASSPVCGVTSEKPSSDGTGEGEVFGTLHRGNKEGRLMRPGGSFVSNVISIQPRRPLLPLPIISQSFGSATSLCLREGRHRPKREKIPGNLNGKTVRSHDYATLSNHSQCQTLSFCLLSGFSASLSVALSPPSPSPL